MTEFEVKSPHEQKPPENAEGHTRWVEQWRDIRYFLIKLGVVALILWVALAWVFGFAVMRGESMYPRLRDGDLLMYYRLQQEYRIGDVVLFSQEGETNVGRIVATGGDTVNMNHAGKLIVNGGVQSEEIFYPTYADDAQIELPYTVEDNCVFLLCDFRTNGTDSRSYGSVPLEELDGKVIAFFRCRGI